MPAAGGTRGGDEPRDRAGSQASVARPPRQARVVANDARLLDATVALIDERGADAVTVADLVRTAGLTTGAFYARYDAIGDLLADLWLSRSRAVLAELAEDARAIGADPAGPDTGALAALLRSTPERRVAFELLVLADRVPELADIVGDSVAETLRGAALLGPAPDAGTPLEGAADVRGLGLLALALGAISHDRIDGPFETDAPRISRWFATAATRTWEGEPPPGAPPSEVTFVPSGRTARPESHDGELRRLRLLDAAARVVARSGIARTNLRRISRASGYAHTVIYQEYGGLRELLVDFVRVVSEARVDIATDPARFVTLREDAAWLAGLLAPEARSIRRLALEFWVASAHDQVFAGLTGAADAARARAVATLLVPADGAGRLVVERYRYARRSLGFGLALLEQTAGGLAALDWRPVIGTLQAAALDEAGVVPL